MEEEIDRNTGSPMWWWRATELITTLLEAREERQLLRMRGQLAKLDLLIFDEPGYVPVSEAGAKRLFDVIVSSPDVESPVAVRCAWANERELSLYSNAGLPTPSFRTDARVEPDDQPTAKKLPAADDGK
jgi:hypothetical protein